MMFAYTLHACVCRCIVRVKICSEDMMAHTISISTKNTIIISTNARSDGLRLDLRPLCLSPDEIPQGVNINK